MKTYRYKIYSPSVYNPEENKKWPLILFLHGAGERGNDLSLLQRQGLPAYLKGKDDFPFVVASPQCPARSYWEVHSLNNWLNEVLSEVNADLSRVYLSGISMGGYGTWHWAAANPEKFAAIIPVCGGGDPSTAKKLTKMPVWAFHGEKDDIVPVEETLAMTEAIKEAGGKAELTLYPNLYHDSWTETYNNSAIYEWLLKHSRS